LKEKDIDSTLVKALDISNPWITETALKSCRYLPKLSPNLERRIKMYIEGIDLFSFIRHPKEIIFSFSLSNAFQNVKRICIWKTVISYSTLAAFLIVGLFVPILFLIFPFLYVGIKFFDILPRRTNAVMFFLPFWFPLCLVALLVVPIFRTPTRYTGVVPYSKPRFIALLLFVLIFAVPWYLIPIPRLNVWKFFKGVLIALIVALLALAVGFGMNYAIDALLVPMLVAIPDHLKAILSLLALGVALILGLIQAFKYIKKWMMDYKNFRSLVKKPFPDRRQISEAFNGFRTNHWRLKLVRFLQSAKLKPTGMWPDGKIPNMRNDKASTLLARLEEGWLGLDR
jgi:hypothetical protein